MNKCRNAHSVHKLRLADILLMALAGVGVLHFVGSLLSWACFVQWGLAMGFLTQEGWREHVWQPFWPCAAAVKQGGQARLLRSPAA
jgi:hypothetical protein